MRENLSVQEQAYIQGFMYKCAEHGVDPMALAKWAAESEPEWGNLPDNMAADTSRNLTTHYLASPSSKRPAIRSIIDKQLADANRTRGVYGGVLSGVSGVLNPVTAALRGAGNVLAETAKAPARLASSVISPFSPQLANSVRNNPVNQAITNMQEHGFTPGTATGGAVTFDRNLMDSRATNSSGAGTGLFYNVPMR